MLLRRWNCQWNDLGEVIRIALDEDDVNLHQSLKSTADRQTSVSEGVTEVALRCWSSPVSLSNFTNYKQQLIIADWCQMKCNLCPGQSESFLGVINPFC